MPTENRSSNTELISQAASAIEDLLANGTGAVAAGAWSNLPAELRKLTYQPAPQPHAEPIAWTVGTAFWWTKEEAERDSAATGLPIIGLGAMVDPVVAERLRTATDFVQRMVECAGIQQSVATGYVRDILDVLKGSAAPSAPVELQRMTFEYVHADGERHTVALSREEVAGYMDEFLFEKLTDAICHCESIGETNVVDCRCDEVAEQYKLANPA
ncbi:hypothetical protein [Pseudomonas soli]|jgi:hypothetical protein|uniref:hypothetical protein n=1 Tax=Pseudomonas soli TaxID=1306993 RepID=UPI002893DB6E|nr:hypothetical protein [Pseudomonas soli]MDT3716271.1 hypothetical protein [Pseudomonas soli]MDT3732033.1 hypothetical protein [Pseudomonas soli]